MPRLGDLVFLDAQVLGKLAHPRATTEAAQVQAWVRRLLAAGVRFFVAEISDYEVRRELVRARKEASVRRLDLVRSGLDFAPLTSPAMDLAARLWAEARWRGRPPCADGPIDADVILAAQALTAAGSDRSVVIASANTRHLAQFCETRPWFQIDLETTSEVPETPVFLTSCVPS